MPQHQVIAVGSVDGVLTTAAYIRWKGWKKGAVQVAFTQAFDVQKIEVVEGAILHLIDLAVNNRDFAYTQAFIDGALEKGCRIESIVDEHDAAAWQRVLPVEVWEGLKIKPVSQASGSIKSSGALLLSHVGSLRDGGQFQRLCEAADLADQGRFQGVANFANKAIKANIRDNARREYLAWHLSRSNTPDPLIESWVQEYEQIEANMAAAISSAEERSGYVYVNTRGVDVDMTSLSMRLAAKFAYPQTRLIVARGQAYDKSAGGVIPCYSFMAHKDAPSDFDIQAILPKIGFGFAKKLNVVDEDFPAALAEVEAWLAQ